nr:MAG TPA: hypothetical protein [Caudoviricetes sp.]
MSVPKTHLKSVCWSPKLMKKGSKDKEREENYRGSSKNYL